MSTRKRSLKDKPFNDEVALHKSTAFMLASDRAVLCAANDYPGCSDRTNMRCGRPPGAMIAQDWIEEDAWQYDLPPPQVLEEARSFVLDAQHGGLCSVDVPTTCTAVADATQQVLCAQLNRHCLQSSWRRHVARTLRSTLLYPHHSLRFIYRCPASAAREELQALSPRQQQRTLSPRTASVGGVVPVLLTNAESSVHEHEQPSHRHPNYQQLHTHLRDLASLIRKMILAHCRICNLHAGSAPEGVEMMEVLLAHSIYSDGYPGSQREERDVTFTRITGSTTAAADGNAGHSASLESKDAAAAGSEAEDPALRVVCHYGATHICVCCGLFYYRLSVLDPVTRVMRSQTSIIKALEVITRDAAERVALTFAARSISDEAKEDLKGFHELLTRMSALPDALDVELHRRLREVSAVNGYALDCLEGCLFSVSLKNCWQCSGDATAIAASAENVGGTQWLHSILSLHADRYTPNQFELRAHATVVSMATLSQFLRYAVAEQDEGEGDEEEEEGGEGVTKEPTVACSTSVSRLSVRKRAAVVSIAGDHVQPTEGDGAFAATSVSLAGDVSATNVSVNLLADKPSETSRIGVATIGEGVECLELWLPVKHRIPLRPYSPAVPTPHFSSLMSLARSAGVPQLSVAELCLALVLSTERVACATNNQRRPRVLLALHHPQSTTPSAILLYSPEVEAFIQAVRSSSVLITREVRIKARDAALASIATRIERCASQPYPLYWMAAHLAGGCGPEQLGEMANADMCVYVNALPLKRGGTTRNMFEVTRCTTNLGIPARIQVNCTGQQVKVQKRLSMADTQVKVADMGAGVEEDDFATALREWFTNEVLLVSGDAF